MFQGLAVSHESSLSVHGFAGRTVSVPNLFPSLKNAKTVICLKNKLKTHLFRKAFLF